MGSEEVAEVVAERLKWEGNPGWPDECGEAVGSVRCGERNYLDLD